MRKFKLYDDPEDDEDEQGRVIPFDDDQFGGPEASINDENIYDASDNVEAADSQEDEENEDQLPKKSRLGNNLADVFNSLKDAPEGLANSRYRQFLESDFPTRDKPTKMNRLAAVLGGISEGYMRKSPAAGFAVQDKILNEPYEKKIADFNNKAKLLQSSAALEDKGLGRKASLARTAANVARDQGNLELGQDKLDRQINVDKVNAAYKQAQIDRMKNPGLTYKVANGELVGIDRAGKVVTKYGDANMLGPNAVAQKRALAAFTSGLTEGRELKLEGVRDTNRRAQSNINAGHQLALQENSDENIRGRSAENPHNMAVSQVRKMREGYAKWGEAAKDYFIFDKPGGLPIGLKPGDPEDPAYLRIYKFVYGGE